MPTVLSIQGSPTGYRRLYSAGRRPALPAVAISSWSSSKGRGPVHDHMRTKALAANEAVIMASVGHVVGRTEWDRRLASVMAPQAVYHSCDEPLRPPFYQASWRAEAAVPGRIISISGIYARKGVGTLLRAFDVLRRIQPRTTLVLAGVFPNTVHERATIEARATLLASRTA